MAAITLDGAPLEVASRVCARARRITLRVGAADGRVTLTRPRGVPESEALAFASARGAWLRARLAALPAAVAVAPGATVPVEGVPVRVVAGARPALAGGEMRVPAERPGPAAERLLRARAAERLVPLCAAHAAVLGCEVARIVLRDTRGRWGSCTAAGRLMFSWRLAMAPPAVLAYVAAHEAAHLAHMDHGPAFWAAVGRLMPDHEAPRRWLRAEGAGLHRYRFGAPSGTS